MASTGRLTEKTAVLTGGAGGIGRVIAKRYLEEGARLILTGRTLAKLTQTHSELVAELGGREADVADRIFCVAMDGSNPESLKQGIAQIRARFKSIDILINNAGSAGPRETLANLPLTPQDLERLRATGSSDTETLRDAVGSLLGGAWFTTQAFLPYLAHGASVINVSTIFSRTEYYGRIAYVAPKAALNALSKFMATELGQDPRGIRVNTVYPGPVESERIHSVFATMDKLKGAAAGTTSKEIVGQMLMQHSPTGTNYLSKDEVAETVVFLGSDASTAFSGHDFQVTHGLQIPRDNYTDVISRPNLRVVDLEGKLIWIIAGDQLEEASQLALRHHELGADIFLTFRDPKACEQARARFEQMPGFIIDLLDPLNPEHWHNADTKLYLKHQLPQAAIVLPAFGAGHFSSKVVTAGAEEIQDFFDREIIGAIAVAQRLDQIYSAADKRLASSPVVVFLGNGSDGRGNAFASIRAAAVRQLIRVWRHETQIAVQNGRRHVGLQINQLIRSENEEANNLDLACEWAISLANGLRRVRNIDLCLAPNLGGSAQGRIALNWERQALRGLHLRKVALITGGSEGIGGETARLLALSGARVAIAARAQDKLERARQAIVEELKIAGYSDPESRVLIIPDCDVADPKAIETMVDQTLARFGRIDYLINNAGISGQEQMVADMSVESWSRTLMANLNSNYDLICRVLPVMKKQKCGHILNVSSHFGGVRHATVAYPNRSDYAVSKAGQRALAESLAVFLGPDVQINAVAPGPVDGVRLRGTDQRPGLYARRAKLILEAKRLNLVYSALVTAFRMGEDLNGALEQLACNSIAQLATAPGVTEPLRVLCKSLQEKPIKDPCGANTHLLTRVSAERLLSRLRLGAFLPVGFAEDRFLARLAEAPEPFFSRAQIEADAVKIKSGVLSTLALQRMPSENDVAREMVFYLANRNVTGETLHPSCGLMLEKLTMSGDFVGRTHPEIFAELQDQTILIVGDSMPQEMAHLAAEYLRCSSNGRGAGVRKVALVALSETTAEQIRAACAGMGIAAGDDGRLSILTASHRAADRALDQAIAKHGLPQVVVSFPAGRLEHEIPKNTGSWEKLPTHEQFDRLVEEQLTHHFLVAKRASLIDACRVVFVTPRLAAKADAQASAFANFIRTSLRPLTVTAGQEGARLIHRPIFNQVDSGGSSTSLSRFSEAILLMSLPVHSDAADGQKPALEYFGTTITV